VATPILEIMQIWCTIGRPRKIAIRKRTILQNRHMSQKLGAYALRISAREMY